MQLDIGTYKFVQVKRFTATEKMIGTSWTIVVVAFVVGGVAVSLVAAMGVVGALMVIKQ